MMNLIWRALMMSFLKLAFTLFKIALVHAKMGAVQDRGKDPQIRIPNILIIWIPSVLYETTASTNDQTQATKNNGRNTTASVLQ